MFELPSREALAIAMVSSDISYGERRLRLEYATQSHAYPITKYPSAPHRVLFV